jgi:SNF2 family DNA or RNA helicase
MNIEFNTPTAIKLETTTKSGTVLRTPAVIQATPARIEFLKSPFSLKDEIKVMRGAKWHGFMDPPRKIWSIENCDRNWFQLRVLMGENPYEWFDRPIQSFQYERDLRAHQVDLSNAGLTYHFQLFAAEMGLGKTLSAIEVMEHSGKKKWWWVGPRSGLYAVEREFKKWEINSNLEIELMTYEGLVKRMGFWKSGDPAPMGIVFDEISRCKTARTQRTQAAQAIADGVRSDWGMEGYVIGMSGTPSPKTPVDWWAPCEIIWPGFLREGDVDAFKFRLGIHRKEEGAIGNAYWQLVDWRDDENKCDICGEYAEDGNHTHLIREGLLTGIELGIHDFQPSKNEVAYLNDRLANLVVVRLKKDCLDLPEKQYRQVYCTPTPATLRVASSLLKAAPNTITGLNRLRELSDGFQYRDKVVGKETCPICDGTCKTMYWVDPQDAERAFTMIDMLDPEYVSTLVKTEFPCASCSGTGEVNKIEREVREVPCPKDEALINLLDENEETGRLVVFAGFTGSIDRVTKICLQQGWDVIRVDGRGWIVYQPDGQVIDTPPLDHWADMNKNRVCFVAHPKSGGMALTLVESRMICYFSNDYNPESRSQSEDRIHRIGMDMNRGATIVDLLHLPTDEKILGVLKANRRLELMSMGEFQKCFEGDNDATKEDSESSTTVIG